MQKYLSEEPVLKTDLGQKEEIPAAFDEHMKSTQAQDGLVDWKKGKLFCMEDEEFYREMLQTFLDSPSAVELRRYYEESDFENYRIKIHAMKANLANIGAMVVSDMAKRLELALKNDNHVSYVQESHDEFMAVYEKVVSEVKTYMENAWMKKRKKDYERKIMEIS